MKKLKNNKGITTVALIVTIVVLLILAGITIGILTGENGLIEKTKQSKENTEIAEEKEILNLAIIQAMEKGKYGDLTKENLQIALDETTKEGETEVSKIRKKTVVKFTESERTYYVDMEGNIFEYVYADLSNMEWGLTFYNRMSEYRTQILNVKVVDYIEKEIENYKNFDVSQNQDGSIMAWLIPNADNEEYYDLYIGGNDGVKANVSCQNLFASLENCLTIDLEHFYTENTTNFNYMFMGCKNLLQVNLDNIDTSCATTMNAMFASCNNLEEINLSKFNTSNVKDMGCMLSRLKKSKKY